MKKKAWCQMILVIALAGTTLLASCAKAERRPDQTNDQFDNGKDITIIPTEISTPAAVETEAPPPAHQASGLIFTNADGTWWINRAGELELLIDEVLARRSTDGKLFAYIAEDPVTSMGDVWVMDISTGERRNLTDTPDRDEGYPVWIPNRMDILIFGSDTATGMENSSYPTVVGIDGTGYRILDSENGGFRAVSPDGESIIYGGYDGTVLFYTWDHGTQVFNPADYGLAVEKLFLPAWSPDGRYVAWFVASYFTESETSQLGIAVFDLEKKTSQVMHTYQPLGGSMFNNDLTWSPDGAWLAFTTYGEPPATGRAPNLWVIQPDGQQETYIGSGSVPVWRYDGQMLAFQSLTDAQTEAVYLVTAGSWDVKPVNDLSLPERILFLMDWILP
jgi:Tol biopolymer transport system component